MKDLLTEKIEIEVKLVHLQLIQNYYSKRIDWTTYTELSAKLNTNKKALISLIESDTDLSVRNTIEPQQYPYSYYVKHLKGPDTNNV